MGYPGSGKTTVAEILRQKGLIAFEFFDYFKNTLAMQDMSRQEILKAVKDYVQRKGREAVISGIILWIEGKIPRKYDRPVFLIGARHSADVKILKSLRTVAFCILVRSSKKKRVYRIIERNRAIDKGVINEIKNKNDIAGDKELTTCIKEHTDYIIENYGKVKDLKKKVDLLLNELGVYYES